jgi:hypothetical protein
LFVFSAVLGGLHLGATQVAHLGCFQ